jgi:hypothetical protein
MKTKRFTITENVLVSQGQRLNVIIDSLFIYILILSAGTTIVLIKAQITLQFLAGLKHEFCRNYVTDC